MDIPLLYFPVTPEAIENGYAFYSMWWEAPAAVKVNLPSGYRSPATDFVFRLCSTLRCACLCSHWSASCTAGPKAPCFSTVQVSVSQSLSERMLRADRGSSANGGNYPVPLRTHYLPPHLPYVPPIHSEYIHMLTFCSVPEGSGSTSFSLIPPPAPRDAPPTESERVEALRVLSAGNALVGLLLLGIIGMQVGQEYARRVEEREQRELDARLHGENPAASASPPAETKKDI